MVIGNIMLGNNTFLIIGLIVAVGVIIFLLIFNKKGEQREASALPSYYKDIIVSLQDAIIVYDNKFKIIVFNPSAQKILKLSEEEVLGGTFGPERTQEKKYEALVQILFPSLAPSIVNRTEPGVYPQVADIAFTSPPLNLRVATNPLYANGEIIGFFKVITNKTRETQIFKSQADFITTAAHQLRTPVTQVEWALETLSKIELPGKENKDFALQGLASARKMSKIITDLLDVSKIDEGKMGYAFQNVNIIIFIEEVLKNVKSYIKNTGLKISVDFKHEEKGITVKADPNKLGMAVSNILDNAIRYNTKNGSIILKIDKIKDRPYIEVSISDAGIGIPPEDLPKIFTKFFRSENAVKVQTEGSGLGLYIANKIIKRHGGAMRVESILGRGATVYFTLPIDPNLVPAAEFIYEDAI